MSKPEYPVNTWLQDAVRLAADNISSRIDREAGNRPWFWVDLKADPPCLVHDYWDFCDMSGRWADALILARLMLGPREDDAEQVLKAFVLDRQRPDGFFYNEPEPGSHNDSCEVCSLTDMIHLALQLTDAGAGDHWDFIDTTIRNQMLEQQFRAPEVLIPPEQAERSQQPLLAGIRGAVESWGMPNTLVGYPRGLEGCCTSALVRACYFAWHRAAQDSGGRVWVHLPFSRAGVKLDVLSHEPWHGAITLKIHRACDASVRVSKWIDERTLRVTRNGRPINPALSGRYLVLDGLAEADTVRISYPLTENERSYTIGGKHYEAVWRGDTVVELTPPGEPYPIFQRDRIDDIPTGHPNLGCADTPVTWHP